MTIRVQRRRIFLGCEGESEQSYARLLAELLERHHRRFHIESHVLQPGAGDPLALIEKALKVIRRTSDRSMPFVARAVLIDSDTRDQAPERTARALAMARVSNLRVIWQEPCHEAFLLNHLPNCETLRPSSAKRAHELLTERWANYKKALPARQLGLVIDQEGVSRAARVHDQLASFLMEIEFPLE